jgi:hypothetical protein
MTFTFRLEREDGRPANPPTLKAAAPNSRPGDTIALGLGRMFRVIDVRVEEGPDGDPVSVLVFFSGMGGPSRLKRLASVRHRLRRGGRLGVSGGSAFGSPRTTANTARSRSGCA